MTIMVTSCEPQVQVNYLDDDFPSGIPKKYAEGIINLHDRFQQNMTISSDGKEHFFTETNDEEWRCLRILRVKSEGAKAVLDTPQFVLDFDFKNEVFIGEPMLSPDNSKLLFNANYPPSIWIIDRSPSGDWESPRQLSISTSIADWYPTMDNSNNLYFTNGSVFKSSGSGDKYQTKSRLSIPKGDADISDPFVDPENSYIIFAQRTTADSNQTDLFVTTNNNGEWSQPLDLGERINTHHFELAPYVSPDKKYLFFSRRDTWQNASCSSIYWVSMEVVDERIKTIRATD